jgi:exonuclease III
MSLSKQTKSHSLTIVHWNCFKLTQNRILDLGIFLQDFKPDIMSIQEVKLIQEEVNVLIRFPDYSTYYKPRLVNPSFGGGVLVLIKNRIGSSEISDLDVSVDHLGIKIDSNGLKLNLVSLYAPAGTLELDRIKNYCK